jgi:hypothetical protein
MPKSKKKKTGGIKWSTLRLDRFRTDKHEDITDLGQAVAPKTKNKFNPSLYAPEYDDVSNNVIPYALTTGKLAPLKYTRKRRAKKLPGPIGGAG